VDFPCLPARLVIEADRNQHGVGENANRDEHRTAYLAPHGFRVLRFSNRDVMTSIHVVLDTIHAGLSSPTPTPIPPREGQGIGGAV